MLMNEKVKDINLHRLNKLQASVDALTELFYVMHGDIKTLQGDVKDIKSTMASAGQVATVQRDIGRLNRNYGDINNRVATLELDKENGILD
jgi:hypothetical protein